MNEFQTNFFNSYIERYEGRLGVECLIEDVFREEVSKRLGLNNLNISSEECAKEVMEEMLEVLRIVGESIDDYCLNLKPIKGVLRL